MTGRPDFTGNQNISQQSIDTVRTTAEIKANTANQLDLDIDNFDLIGNGDYESEEYSISGAIEVVLAGASEYDCNVFVEWTDGNENVLYTEQPGASQNTQDFSLLYPTGSTHVKIRVEDASNQTQNHLDMTVNAH